MTTKEHLQSAVGYCESAITEDDPGAAKLYMESALRNIEIALDGGNDDEEIVTRAGVLT